MMNFLWQTTGNALFVGATSAILIFIALRKYDQSMNIVLIELNESLMQTRKWLLELEDRVEKLEKDTK